MRPEISDDMAKRIRELDEYHGYQNVSEFIREAARMELQNLETKEYVVKDYRKRGVDVDIDDVTTTPEADGGVNTESIEHRLNAIERSATGRASRQKRRHGQTD